MTTRAKGVAVLVVQMAVVLSVAVKYAWERHACPQVWVRTTQYDPDLPVRGRYLALNLMIDSCGLPRDQNGGYTFSDGDVRHTNYSWSVTTGARDGKLVAVIWDKKHAIPTEEVTARDDTPCAQARLRDSTEFYVSEHAKSPFPLAKGQELWALVTVPPQGPPRAVQLAVSDGKQFRVLDLR